MQEICPVGSRVGVGEELVKNTGGFFLEGHFFFGGCFTMFYRLVVRLVFMKLLCVWHLFFLPVIVIECY